MRLVVWRILWSCGVILWNLTKLCAMNTMSWPLASARCFSLRVTHNFMNATIQLTMPTACLHILGTVMSDKVVSKRVEMLLLTCLNISNWDDVMADFLQDAFPDSAQANRHRTSKYYILYASKQYSWKWSSSTQLEKARLATYCTLWHD